MTSFRSASGVSGSCTWVNRRCKYGGRSPSKGESSERRRGPCPRDPRRGMKYVLDASVALKGSLPEDDSPRSLAIRDRFSEQLIELIALDVFPIEVAHALAKAERRKSIAPPLGNQQKNPAPLVHPVCSLYRGGSPDVRRDCERMASLSFSMPFFLGQWRMPTKRSPRKPKPSLGASPITRVHNPGFRGMQRSPFLRNPRPCRFRGLLGRFRGFGKGSRTSGGLLRHRAPRKWNSYEFRDGPRPLGKTGPTLFSLGPPGHTIKAIDAFPAPRGN